jgi:hypothetical protein
MQAVTEVRKKKYTKETISEKGGGCSPLRLQQGLTAKPADSIWSAAAAGRLQLIGKKLFYFYFYFLSYFIYVP